jgi:tRNA pseudouridine13 synthase
MRRARGALAEREDELLRASGVTWEELERSRLVGSRRAARVFPADTAVEDDAHGLRLCFRLPKGSYATVLLREVTRGDVGAESAAEEG